MRLIHYLQEAFTNIEASRLRSFFATLGVLVGTASIVALMNCGQLATEKALEQFKTLGTNLISVSTFLKTTDKLALREQVSLNVWQKIPYEIPAIELVAPYSATYQSLSFQGYPLEGVIVSADEHLARILLIDLAAGSFVSFVNTYERYCVIGHGIAQEIQHIQAGSPIGRHLRIGNTIYTIIGVAKSWKENNFFNEDINQAVIIPLGGRALVNRDTAINNAVLRLFPGTDIDGVIAHLNILLEKQGPNIGVFVRSAKQIIASMENQSKIFSLLLTVLGSISLIVGGVGIMNVMLVSVNERKKEIGIRKAVGAKNRDIQFLFLTEAIFLSLLGGVLGVIIGLLFTYCISRLNGWVFKPYVLSLVIGFFVSVIMGIFFGFYPAKRASTLEPIASLRN